MAHPSHPEMAACPEQDESVSKTLWGPPAGIYGHAIIGSHVDSDDSTEPDDATVREST